VTQVAVDAFGNALGDSIVTLARADNELLGTPTEQNDQTSLAYGMQENLTLKAYDNPGPITNDYGFGEWGNGTDTSFLGAAGSSSTSESPSISFSNETISDSDYWDVQKSIQMHLEKQGISYSTEPYGSNANDFGMMQISSNSAMDNLSKKWMLPQRPEESGYYTYGTPANGEGQFTHPAALSVLFDVEANWAANNNTKFGVGNISLESGAPFPPHKTHQSGLEIDVRPLRTDGLERPVTWKDKEYDREATQTLIDMFKKTGRVEKIIFNDPQIKDVTPSLGHDNHLHIKVKP
jgi:hypothetical protein